MLGRVTVAALPSKALYFPQCCIMCMVSHRKPGVFMSELVAVISHEVLREMVKVVAVKDDLSAVDACLSSHELPGHYNLIGCLRVDDGESFINQLSNQRSQDTLGDGWFRIPCSEAMATCAALASSMDQERM
ncbi:MAG: hypothetical protein AAFO75_14185, partial [Pseudomonadota bacterium]